MAAKGMNRISAFMKKMRFQKKLIGGVDEADVWRQMDLLQKEYRSVYEAQQAYYQALLDERDETIEELRSQLRAVKSDGGVYGKK